MSESSISDPCDARAPTTRRRVLALLGAGGAALVAGQLSANQALAADGDTLLLGQQNSASGTTSLDASPEGITLCVTNGSTGEASGAITGESPAGVGVQGNSMTGTGGAFWSDSGYGLLVNGTARFESLDTMVGVGLFVDNANQSDDAGGIGAMSRGGQPAVSGTALPCDTISSGVGVQGISTASDETWADGPGIGVRGLSGTGPGVQGGSDTGPGVTGNSRTNIGGDFRVDDASESGIGCQGVSGGDPWGEGSGIGVQGLSGAIGVRGHSPGADVGMGPGVGTQGESEVGIGVQGNTRSGIGVMGSAELQEGLALSVHGRAAFSTAGAGGIPAGASDVFVPEQLVGATSHITVTLTSDPGARYVRWVERVPGSGFRVYLSSVAAKQRVATIFTYLIVEPAVG